MLFGDFVGGAFASGCTHSNDTMKMFAFNGRGSFRSEESTGERFLVEVFTTAGTAEWSDDYKSYLEELGFRLSLGDTFASGSVDQGGGTTAGPASRIGGGCPCYQALASKDHDRVLVEGCCEPGSLLQEKTKFSKGCKVVPITKDDDFASVTGMRKCMQNLRSPTDTLWFSAPCTGMWA